MTAAAPDRTAVARRPALALALVVAAFAACVSLLALDLLRAPGVRGTAVAVPGVVAMSGGAVPAAARFASLVTQVRSPWMPDGPTASTDCGPAAMASALRLAGLDVPGAAGLHDRRLLVQARRLATGTSDGAGRLPAAGEGDGYTYLPQLAHLARLAGARTRVTGNLATALDWSRGGAPVLLQGAPLTAWDSRLPTSVVRHVAGGHYVVLAGPVAGHPGWWWLLEPLGVRGPIAVTTPELVRFVDSWHGAAMRVART